MDELDFVDERKTQSGDVKDGALSQNNTMKRSSRRKRRLGGFTSRLGRGIGDVNVDTDARSSSSLPSSSSPSSQDSLVSSSPAASSLLSCTASSLATHDTSNAVLLASPNDHDNDRVSGSVVSKSERSLRSNSSPSTPPTPPTPPSPETPPSSGSKMGDVNAETTRKRQASSSSSSSSSFSSRKNTTASSSSMKTTSFTTKKRQRQFLANNYKEQKHAFDTNEVNENDEGDYDDDNEKEEREEENEDHDYNKDYLPPQALGDVQVTGAGTDVFAVQDAGLFRLVQDDCAYLCSSFLSSIGADRDRNTYGANHDNSNNCDQNRNHYNSNNGSSNSELMKNIRQSSSITAGAACDLALMLSCKKTRDDLVNLGSGVENEFSQESFLSDATEDNDAVQGVLDVLSFAPPSIVGCRLPASFLYRNKERHMEQKTNADGAGRVRGYDLIVAEALSLLANFLSFDCTQNTKYSASPSPSAASSFRKTMLRHSGAMRAIARLSLADPLVMEILGKNVDQTNEIIEEGEPIFDSQEIKQNDSLDEAETTQRKKKKRRIRYSTDEDDNKKKPVGDPTKAGRRKKNRRLKKLNDKSVSKPLSSSSPNLNMYRTKLERASKVQNDIQVATEFHDTAHEHRQSPGFVALNAFKRIITGKFDDDDQNDVCNEEDGDDSSQHNDNDIECDDLEKQNLKNPLIFRNIMIRRSGALPFLSRAMTESLEAAVFVFNDVNTPDRTKRLEYLSERIQCLSSILDALCCLSAENRRILCGVGLDVESFDAGNNHDPILIPSLLRAITVISIAPSVDYTATLPEIVLASFRTLTSMTHENDLAGVQLMKKYKVQSDESNNKCQDSVSGFEVLMTVLHSLITLQQDIRDGKHAEPETHQKNVYDAIVFTMNTLTNILETPSANDARRIVLGHRVKSNESDKISTTLSWLTRWVVSQTSTFQDAVIINDFGDSNVDTNENSQQRDLQHHEDEFLVQAGNGFILLACFLIGVDCSHAETDSSLDQKIRKEIMSEMPQNDGISRGMPLIINTLKAFCNFYRYSIGELSVAVVDPVLKLISKLEKIQ